MDMLHLLADAFLQMEFKDYMALWGAGLSTLLAIKEAFKSRQKLEVGSYFTGDVDGAGNKFFLRNHSNKPIIVTRYNVLVCRKKLIGWAFVDSRVDDDIHDNFIDIVIAPCSSVTLQFNGDKYFSTKLDGEGNDALFLEIYISGRRNSKLFKVVYKSRARRIREKKEFRGKS